MQKRVEVRPFTLNPGALYAREVKSQLMKTILVVGAYFVVQIIAGQIIVTAIMLSSGLMDDIMRSAMDMAGGGTLDYGSLIESSGAATQESISDHIGLITIISALCGLPLFLLLRGRRMITTDVIKAHAYLSGRSFLTLWVIAMGAQLVFDAGAYLINTALESSGRSATELLNQAMQMFQTPSGLLYICLIGPIVEELIFRGAIMRSLERFGLNFSIVISSLIFGLFHIFTVQAVFAFFIGMILGYIASRYSLKWSILAHIMINSAATGLSALGLLGGEGGGVAVFSGIVIAIEILFFVGGVAFLIRERWRFAEQRAVGAPIRIPGSPENVGAALWSAAFTSAPLLIYIAVTIAAGVVMIFFPSFNLPI
jgi:membrane protease YdiL (CAAX protease family)